MVRITAEQQFQEVSESTHDNFAKMIINKIDTYCSQSYN